MTGYNGPFNRTQTTPAALLRPGDVITTDPTNAYGPGAQAIVTEVPTGAVRLMAVGFRANAPRLMAGQGKDGREFDWVLRPDSLMYRVPDSCGIDQTVLDGTYARDVKRVYASKTAEKRPLPAKRKTSIRVLAQRALREVKRTFAAYLDDDGNGPVLLKDWGTISGSEAPYAIVWEGGPHDWASMATAGGVDEEVTTLLRQVRPHAEPVRYDAIEVEGAFLEPYTSYALGVYRA